ncbi:hypothetical protein DPEC_G00283190 [Dallia pectoralis]|uniref:Uncharacterized protein n=1 Tax=Dallia pectoralis TaxID=75939 RepID=A0ACC2FJ59_DALPE|nr:hypothetical protein DPEC_G00283190 [Dallia pectoralis]
MVPSPSTQLCSNCIPELNRNDNRYTQDSPTTTGPLQTFGQIYSANISALTSPGREEGRRSEDTSALACEICKRDHAQEDTWDGDFLFQSNREALGKS